ncbi:hypothetical protein LTR56_006195 [Elasticomyces elasticus]|nr:hypothetical protein LTR56_006195 [Elasticomyces elasticus]KAK4928271.1 hypothetical protein LTR49_004948 [Elasticomyces elasticus]KAK5763834.1 hypothetical protein LTS12_005952 [Elasticomyces elasticus]
MKLLAIVFPLLLAGAYAAPLPPPDDDTSDAGRHRVHPFFGPPPPNGDTTDAAVHGLGDPTPFPPTRNDTSDAGRHGLDYAGSLSQPGDDIMMPPPQGLGFVAPLSQRNYDTPDAAVHGPAYASSLSQPNDDTSDAATHGLGFAAPLPLPINDDGPAAATRGPVIPNYARDISLTTPTSTTSAPIDPVDVWHGHFGGGDGEGRSYPPSDPIDGDDWRGHTGLGGKGP